MAHSPMAIELKQAVTEARSALEEIKGAAKEFNRIPKGSRWARIDAVIQITGASNSKIYDWVGKRLFPAPFKLGSRSNVWNLSEVQNWMVYVEEEVRFNSKEPEEAMKAVMGRLNKQAAKVPTLPTLTTSELSRL